MRNKCPRQGLLCIRLEAAETIESCFKFLLHYFSSPVYFFAIDIRSHAFHYIYRPTNIQIPIARYFDDLFVAVLPYIRSQAMSRLSTRRHFLHAETHCSPLLYDALNNNSSLLQDHSFFSAMFSVLDQSTKQGVGNQSTGLRAILHGVNVDIVKLYTCSARI